MNKAAQYLPRADAQMSAPQFAEPYTEKLHTRDCCVLSQAPVWGAEASGDPEGTSDQNLCAWKVCLSVGSSGWRLVMFHLAASLNSSPCSMHPTLCFITLQTHFVCKGGKAVRGH